MTQRERTKKVIEVLLKELDVRWDNFEKIIKAFKVEIDALNRKLKELER